MLIIGIISLSKRYCLQKIGNFGLLHTSDSEYYPKLHQTDAAIRYQPKLSQCFGLQAIAGFLGGFFLGLPTVGIAQTTVYWDRNGNTTGAGGASPSGTWVNNNSDPNRNWSTSSAGTAATARWDDGNYAVFSAGTDATGSYTVTVKKALI